MAKFYLHKETIIIIVICLVVVSGTYLYARSEKPPALNNEIAAKPMYNSVISTSSDDWRKQFLDSSLIQNSSKSTTTDQKSEDLSQTLTGKVSRDFFARYIQLKQSGLDTNSQLVQDNIDQTIEMAQSESNQPAIISEKDIIITNNQNSDAIRAYGNTVGDIFGKYGPVQSPADIASNAFNQNDMSLLSQIDPIISNLNKISKLLKSTPVPQILAQNQVDLINSINSMINISQGLRNIQGDPMQSIISLGNYDSAQSGIMMSLFNIQSALNNAHITFKDTEPGIIFSKLTFQ